MKIAVVGCLHGELDIIYERIEEEEKRQNIVVDLLLICGDFQAIRNANDLKCIAVPDKYKQLGMFHRYYFGEKLAPKLTILIGGNHEAANYLQTLPYGGWIAPNMYYMGYASVVRFGGLRIGGASGIFKFHDAKLGHFESLPYDASSMRSAYHMRETEVYKLLQLSPKFRGLSPQTNSQLSSAESDSKIDEDHQKFRRTLDIFVSHDWPLNIHQFGNIQYLLRKKPFFRGEVESNRLGNPLLQPLVCHLKPQRWFSAHLHVSFRASVKHPNNDNDNSQELSTEFQALDKVLRNRHFLEIFDVKPEKEQNDDIKKELQYDAEWLAILKKTDHLMSTERRQITGIDIFKDQNKVEISEDDIKQIHTLLNGDLTIPQNFSPSEPVLDAKTDSDPGRVRNFANPQTTKLCQSLSIQDPNVLFMEQQFVQPETVPNPDAIDLSDGSDCDEDCNQANNTNKKTKLDTDLFFIDTKGNKLI